MVKQAPVVKQAPAVKRAPVAHRYRADRRISMESELGPAHREVSVQLRLRLKARDRSGLSFKRKPPPILQPFLRSSSRSSVRGISKCPHQAIPRRSRWALRDRSKRPSLPWILVR